MGTILMSSRIMRGTSYWVTYETAGMLGAVKVNTDTTLGTPFVLGPLSDKTAHGVVVKGDLAYAIWLDESVETARLCL